jgi:hypothetical protein
MIKGSRTCTFRCERQNNLGKACVRIFLCLDCGGIWINKNDCVNSQPPLAKRYLHAGSSGQPMVLYCLPYSKYAWIHCTWPFLILNIWKSGQTLLKSV